jgi:hypothetical protein
MRLSIAAALVASRAVKTRAEAELVSLPPPPPQQQQAAQSSSSLVASTHGQTIDFSHPQPQRYINNDDKNRLQIDDDGSSNQSMPRSRGRGVLLNAKGHDPSYHKLKHDKQQTNSKEEVEIEHRQQECDPHKVPKDGDDVNDGDFVGILSCGLGQYCHESSESSLGGVCVDAMAATADGTPIASTAITDLGNNVMKTKSSINPFPQQLVRRRQQVVGRLTVLQLADLFCNRPEQSGLIVDCDCSDMDFENNTGTLSCYFGPDCVDLETGCQADGTGGLTAGSGSAFSRNIDFFEHCTSEHFTANISSEALYEYTSCYTQRMPRTNYTFSYCTDFAFNVFDGPTCDIEIDGVRCNYCDIAIGAGVAYGENCEVFGEYIRFHIVREFRVPSSCSFNSIAVFNLLCNICSQHPVHLPCFCFYFFSCLSIQNEMEDCTNTFLNYAGDRCGAFSDPTLRSASIVEYLYDSFWPCPKGGCNLCGEGGRMTAGYANFTYTTQFLNVTDTFYCYDVNYQAVTGGLYGTSYCDTLPGVVQEVCGCVVVTPPNPPPTTVTNPTDPPAGEPLVDLDPTTQPPSVPSSSSSSTHSFSSKSADWRTRKAISTIAVIAVWSVFSIVVI